MKNRACLLVCYSAVALVLSNAVSHADAQTQTYVKTVVDFVEEFDGRYVENASTASAGRAERSDGVVLPGLFLHPQNVKDAVIRYPDVDIPRPADGTAESCWLLFRIGFRDGIPWETQAANKPNGARFIVRVNGEVVFEEETAGVGWRAGCVDMSPWAGDSVDIEFRTNAINGHTSYDWAVFAQPLLVCVLATEQYLELPEKVCGVALATVSCGDTCEVELEMGAARSRRILDEGVHVIPLHFTHVTPVRFRVLDGQAELTSVRAARHIPEIDVIGMDLSSPLVLVDRPFNVVLAVRNSGLGTCLPGRTLVLDADGGSPSRFFGEAAGREIELGVIEPGETRCYVWEGLKARAPGCYRFTAPETLDLRVFGAELPDLAHKDYETGENGTFCTLNIKDNPVAAVGNRWCRLTFVTDETRRAAYAVAETRDTASGKVTRTGSLYPLCSVSVIDDDEELRRIDMELIGLEKKKGPSLLLRFAQAGAGADKDGCSAEIVFEPADGAARIRISSTLNAAPGTRLASFYGPTVLAGDKAFGTHKDFAIFPGLEYLEAGEESSSERDLAYPLSDRRVPTVHKIATPLMAVQARGSLIALLWDANQQWTPGKRHPAARFLAPAPASKLEHIHMSLFAPSVDPYVGENNYHAAQTPYIVPDPDVPDDAGPIRLESYLVLDNESNYADDSVVHGPHNGGLVLQAFTHWFDAYGFPAPSEPPRSWAEERALCRYAYAHSVWSENPPGWSHCHGWNPGLLVGHAVPQMMDIRAGLEPGVRAEVEHRIDLVLDRVLAKHGKHYLWTNAGCHIMMAELPFYYGYLPESMADFRESALKSIDNRENGLWVWRPASPRHEPLGDAGGHTLGQASYPSFRALRAARMTGDPKLIERVLEAMKQMELYEVPRGAQMWECPMYQPDILAAAQAIRAYCEAYRITGDTRYIEQARYWAWTGLPFLYLWRLEDYPTMLYNVISVIGSTFFTHSWLGLPVVWCGEVYAYALQDLAQYDKSLDWLRITEGINTSTMWQQYEDGPGKGCYPDSWNMVKNKPNPADINPENILVNGFRLRGPSPEIDCVRFTGENGPVMLNSGAKIIEPSQSASRDTIAFTLRGTPGFSDRAMLAPVDKPVAVSGAGPQVEDSDALFSSDTGWIYDADLQAVVLKVHMPEEGAGCVIEW